uniref:Uncharacterized protein B22L22.030 n=1 Tax=Neurospora crassa TaxID=5141 RepID=Q6MWU3_NEUCS|nr:putative protein [Neurospora crassa]
MPKWEEIRDDLFRAFINASGPITPEMQVSIEESMKPYGMKWNAIRSTHTAGLDPTLSVCAISSLSFWSRSSLPPSPQQPTRSIVAGLAIPSSHLNTSNTSNSVTMSSQRSAQRNLTRWDQKTHEDIMLAMFEHFRPTAADMKEIVELLHVQKGHTFTDGALLQHLQKLRRKEGVSAAVASDSGANTSTPTKGRKRAAPGSGVKKTPGTGRGKKAAAAKTAPLVINSDDEDDIKESPEKKLKTEESKVKEEYDDGVDDYMYPNEI